ncbi:spermidine/putrescine ABC transporter ATP-binding protein [[Phormidium ambiguum] IAM M-71]|uniref:Spermidine/putrescine import ATP-binding protein PotA n=1 Tax=[Phormidium ambiguum] IAM M-71 TaxID=454136 RepID=A0A1U7I5T9_9CYAN|nr:ABC transporter ATP-binding protein [Phormidium ambiguum]OKH31625.1 spermidine/putrescine ABC transporter ATP-binding protein [Phormidium ambiguum IAM M-71]
MSQIAVQNQDAKYTHNALDVELRKVFKVFNGETAVRGVDLNIHQGEFFSILGPSGCGKTTTLRLIAGFESPSAGEVLIQNQSMTHVPPYRRPVNTVFQSYALFNHLTVWENVAFGLRIKRLNKAAVADRVKGALKLVKMESLANRFPTQLSGGQQQRVALARALVNRPAVLLLDEPLGALDLKLRKEMQVELSNLHQDLGLTFVMVTHDQEEALSLSDRISVMHEGKIEQIGTPSEIYERPQTAFVADFIGDTNLFRGRVLATEGSDLQVLTDSKIKIFVQKQESAPVFQAQDPVVVSVRPEKIKLSFDPPSFKGNCFIGQLKNVMYLGTHVHCLVELDSGDRMTVMQANNFATLPDANQPVYVYWNPHDCLALVNS